MADHLGTNDTNGFYQEIPRPQRASSRSSQTQDDYIEKTDQANGNDTSNEPFIVATSGPGRLAKTFHSRHQLHTLMIDNFLRWFLTAVVILFIFVTLKVFEKKGATSEHYNNWFNVIITGLSILLALNVSRQQNYARCLLTAMVSISLR